MPKFLSKKYDEFVERNVKDVLTQTGDGVEAGLQDPYAPEIFNRGVSHIFNEVWDEIQDELEESICAGITYGDKKDQMFREFSLIGWPDTPPPAWPPSFKWVRAKLLYALLPADSTLFKKLRDPVGLAVFVLNLWNPFQISVWLFVLLFVLIDKRDEFQLVNFILMFKGFQAVSALLAAHSASMQLFSCALEVGGAPQPEMLRSASFGRAAEYSAPLDKCATGAPGTDADFYYLCMVEPVRLIVVWLAFALLACGYAKGGKEEILALEQVRLDAADGTLDGIVDHAQLRRDEKDRDRGVKGSDLECFTDKQLDEALAKARSRIGARSCVGGVLPYFLAYDLLSALYCVYTYGSIIQTNGFAPDGLFGTKTWQFWVTCFFMQQQYALLAAPFLVFSLPLIGQGLHEAKFTGYDMRGKLCASLGRASVIHLYNQRHEREQKRLERQRKARKKAREGGDRRFHLLRRSSKTDEALDGALSVHVVCGANLPAKDKGGVSDPYVVLHAGSRKAKTTVQHNTVNPKWNETLEISVADATEPVRVKVWDHDKIGMNDLLGEGAIELGSCAPNAMTPLKVALDGNKGVISVEVTWRPNSSGEEEGGIGAALAAAAGGSGVADGGGGAGIGEGGASEAASAASSPPSTPPPSQLKRKMSLDQRLKASVAQIVPPKGRAGAASVVVLRASGLRAADRNGKSDPYVVLQNGGGKKRRTKVQKGTLAPVWAETLEVGVVDTEQPLTLKVWDHDKLGMDDLLGAGTIDLGRCPAGVRTSLEVALGAHGSARGGSGAGGGSGIVQVDVTWRPAEAASALAAAAGTPAAKDKSV